MSKQILKATKHLQIQTSQLAKDLLAGAYHSAFKGQGMEFEEVREYQEGDETRHIDWNVTARMQQPYVKRFREERQAIVLLLFDVSASMEQSVKESTKREIAASIGSLLAACATQNQDKVGALLYSDQVELYIPPKRGVRHLLRIIREMLFYEPKSKGSALNVALEYLGHVHKKSAIVFILSDFAENFSNTLTLSHLTRHHDIIAIQLLNMWDFELPDIGVVTFSDGESLSSVVADTSDENFRREYSAKMSSQRKQNASKWRKAGADIIEMDTAKPFLPLLRQFFRSRKKR